MKEKEKNKTKKGAYKGKSSVFFSIWAVIFILLYIMLVVGTPAAYGAHIIGVMIVFAISFVSALGVDMLYSALRK